jgi:small subunit ribosomal protein S6e
MSFKIVVSDPKTRKSYQKEIKKTTSGLIGKKIGENMTGDFIGLPGYELEVTGGSDKEGFPMRKDVDGQARKRIIVTGPPGFHPERKGERKRKSIRGNTISDQISQVNLKITKHGHNGVEELLGVKAKSDAEPKKEKKQ